MPVLLSTSVGRDYRAAIPREVGKLLGLGVNDTRGLIYSVLNRYERVSPQGMCLVFVISVGPRRSA